MPKGSCPSTVRQIPFMRLFSTVISRLLSGLKTIGRLEREKEFNGVRTKASTSGETIGPQAAAEYAVEPVGVASISPSAFKRHKGSELRFTESIIVETPRSAEITASFKLSEL